MLPNVRDVMDTFRIRGEEPFYVRTSEKNPNVLAFPIARGTPDTAYIVMEEFMDAVDANKELYNIGKAGREISVTFNSGTLQDRVMNILEGYNLQKTQSTEHIPQY